MSNLSKPYRGRGSVRLRNNSLKEAIKFNIDFALTMQACGREELAEKRFKLFMELVNHIPDELKIKIDPRGSDHKLLTGAK
tara:strand:+ start:261 stop:503 length:243 start_codon:yes stop_codon:yes gene_type:complete